MHREIDAAFGQRVFDLLGEHALGADLRESNIGDLVARGLDDLQFNLVAALAQQRGDVVGLPECELRSAGTNSESCHQRRSPVFSLYAVVFFRIGFSRVAQIEELADQIDDRRGFRRFARRALKGRNRCMHDLVDDAAGERFDRQLLLRSQRAQTSAHAIDFRLADRLQMLLQRHDRGHDIERLQPRQELVDLELDDGFGAIGLDAAVGDVRRDNLLQVVDVVHEDAVELVHLRIDIARHSNVDEEHRTVAAAAQKLLAMLFAEDGVRRAGGSDDDVGAIDGVV